jgi:lipopolysaccharide export LptBFGC system permease protein LptF
MKFSVALLAVLFLTLLIVIPPSLQMGGGMRKRKDVAVKKNKKVGLSTRARRKESFFGAKEDDYKDIKEPVSEKKLDKKKKLPVIDSYSLIKTDADIESYLLYIKSEGTLKGEFKKSQKAQKNSKDEEEDILKEYSVVPPLMSDLVKAERAAAGGMQLPHNLNGIASKSLDEEGSDMSFRCKSCKNRVFNKEYRYNTEDEEHYWFKNYFEHEILWNTQPEFVNGMNATCLN